MIKLINSETKQEITENRDFLIQMAKNSLSEHSVVSDDAIISISPAYLKQIEELLKNGSKPASVPVSVGFSVKRGEDPKIVFPDEAKDIKYGE